MGPTETTDWGIQLLTPDGVRREHPDFAADATPAEMRQLYREMVLTRRLDAEATALQRQGELGLWVPSLGQEAAQIGSAHAFTSKDMVFPTYREHGVALHRGVTPGELLTSFRGAWYGGWDPEKLKFALYTIVLGAQTLHAVGYAMGIQRDGSAGEAVAAYFGDGASSQGDVSEAMNWAAVFGAPVVFLCQNNQWAISVPTERQTRTPLYQRAAGFGFPGVRVDGNDVLAVRAVTRWAMERARSGAGPTLVESFTYRMGAHTTSDDPSRYRNSAEVEAWRGRDPIARLRACLNREDLADEQFFSGIDEEADQIAKQTRAACFELRLPAPAEMFDGVYAGDQPELAAQRAEFERYWKSFSAD
jgi:2-oxoisovalerate dehydrogenase E1 component alpha subunit